MDKVIFDVRRKMVLDFIEEKNYKPMKFKELCMVFSVPKREKEEFKEFLDQLIAGGELTLTENGRYKKGRTGYLHRQVLRQYKGLWFCDS